MPNFSISWPVVPLSPGQLLDVNPEHVLLGGHFRLCDVYRGGGGYDRFPMICAKRLREPQHNLQFVVQLRACVLDCPYCYVTREGVWGRPVSYSTDDLVRAFIDSGASVFHLMGGAPALYLHQWSYLLQQLKFVSKPWVFHSDLLLTEKLYSQISVANLVHPRALYAVDVKGVTDLEYKANTRRSPAWSLFWKNMESLLFWAVPFYITFTNVAADNVELFWREMERRFEEEYKAQLGPIREDSFSISLIDYQALPHVDDVPWKMPILENKHD